MNEDMSKGMPKSKIGYTGTGADGRPVDWYYGWNPFGFGCSNLANCPGCWSHGMCHRSACPDCAAFKTHMHRERLNQPRDTKKPGIVLCNFTNDWLDAKRPDNDIYEMDKAMFRAREARHVLVTLTKNAKSAAYYLRGGQETKTVFHGLTIRNQTDADAKLKTFLHVPGNLWLSIEPLQGPLFLDIARPDCAEEDDATDRHCTRCGCVWDEYPDAHECPPGFGGSIRGIIVGHDNRRGAPGTDTLEHVRSVVEQCKQAGIPCYVKQLWTWQDIDGKVVDEHDYTVGKRRYWRLVTSPNQFPPDLQLRNLPWSMPEGGQR